MGRDVNRRIDVDMDKLIRQYQKKFLDTDWKQGRRLNKEICSYRAVSRAITIIMQEKAQRYPENISYEKVIKLLIGVY